jgi:hypothetical protein
MSTNRINNPLTRREKIDFIISIVNMKFKKAYNTSLAMGKDLSLNKNFNNIEKIVLNLEKPLNIKSNNDNNANLYKRYSTAIEKTLEKYKNDEIDDMYKNLRSKLFKQVNNMENNLGIKTEGKLLNRYLKLIKEKKNRLYDYSRRSELSSYMYNEKKNYSRNNIIKLLTENENLKINNFNPNNINNELLKEKLKNQIKESVNKMKKFELNATYQRLFPEKYENQEKIINYGRRK